MNKNANDRNVCLDHGTGASAQRGLGLEQL